MELALLRSDRRDLAAMGEIHGAHERARAAYAAQQGPVACHRHTPLATHTEGGPCTGTKYSVLQCSTTAPAPPKAKLGACFSFETTTEASHNYGKVGISVSWILLALISFNRPILGRYLDGRLRRTAPMSTLTSPSNTHMLIRHRPDMCCMPAQPCAVPQMLSCIIRRVQYSCTTFSTALYSTR